MASLRKKRLDALELTMTPAGVTHHIFKWSSWNEDVVLDHYGRDKIGPDDNVAFIVFRDDHLPRGVQYPAGYFDSDGRWARTLAAHGITR